MPQVSYFVDPDGKARSVKTKKILKGDVNTSRYCLEGSECPIFTPSKVMKKAEAESRKAAKAAAKAAALQQQVIAAGRRRRM